MLILAALLVRALVPSGYMFASRDGVITVEFCDGMTAAPEPAHDATMMAMHHHGSQQDAPAKKPKKADMPCAFAGVSVSAALGTTPVLSFAALRFVVTNLTFGALAAQSVRIVFPHVRPLLRAPPVR